MLGTLFVPKYLDPRIPMVDVHIKKNLIHNTLIYLEEEINVTTKDTMLRLNLQGSLRHTSSLIQLADRSTIDTKGMIEEIIVFVDSCEYPIDLLVLQPKSRFNGYPLILGRPWLEITYAYISCIEGNMTNTNG
jgi:hypothetical protein